MKHHPLVLQLLRMRELDLETRARLAASGELFDGYAPEMEAVHTENAQALGEIVAKMGWPGHDQVGAEAAEAAWLIAQHAISCPELQRMFHAALSAAVSAGTAPAQHLAYLTDRIRFNERRPQVYGTIHDWDERGQLSPWMVESPLEVDERRRSVGLPPLEEATRRLRAEAARAGERPHTSFAERDAQGAEWARRVGWVRHDA